MKKTLALAALSLSLLLAACSTSSTTHVTTYDAEGNTIASKTTTTTSNQTMDAVNKAGTAVKDGVVTGYEWTKDKTVKGYNWVKEKVADDKAPTQGQPAAK
ncbi:MAG: hypothetical protein IKY97_02735 [Mailhella sp.]|nr:hypothetical protein [Mailhella sp.]